ncbi:MAG: LysR family transcriptional regulator [Sutterellaceae bacterium]|nr:LysR family transcriptional regulator [Sutterellaceae bacterium]
MSDQSAIYLQTLFSVGSISQAAKRLDISQPSLTQHIQRIESEWGVEVIDRSVRPFRPTAAGQMVLETLIEMHDAKEACKRALIDLSKGVRGHIRIGVSEYREVCFLTEVIPVFQKKYPMVQLSLVEGTTDQLEEFANAGHTDVSVTIAPTVNSDLVVEDLFEERHLLVIPESSRLIPKEVKDSPVNDFSHLPTFHFAKLDKKPFLIVKRGQRLHGVFQELCRKCEVKPTLVLESESLTAALALANAGLGATIVTDRLARYFMRGFEGGSRKPGVRFFDIDPQVTPRKVVVVRHKSRYVPKAVKALIETMQEVAAK